MRACVQRVSQAQVTVEAGALRRDRPRAGRACWVSPWVTRRRTRGNWPRRSSELRIFDDAAGQDESGDSTTSAARCWWSASSRCLGDCRKGRRPSFVAAAPPELAEALYERSSPRWPAGHFRGHRKISPAHAGESDQRRSGDAGAGHSRRILSRLVRRDGVDVRIRSIRPAVGDYTCASAARNKRLSVER